MDETEKDLEKRVARLERRASREKRARLEAESLLEAKSRELFDVNRNLSRLNETLEERIRDRTEALEAERRKALHLAENDYLTGLPNRLSFTRILEDLAAPVRIEGRGFTLVFCDLDGFKKLNDTYGHVAGDEILKTFADRLRGCLRDGDWAARLGGDEFALIFSNVASAAEATGICNELQLKMEKPFLVGAHQLNCGVSMGGAHFPSDAQAVDELQIYADLALYKAKDEGRGRYAPFEPQLARAYRLRTAIGHALKRDLALGEINMHFQPILGSDRKEPPGCEALLRWEHAGFGPVSPLDTLVAAEEHGFLGELTRQIIANSLRAVARPLRSGQIGWVSINLAERDIVDENLPDFVLDTIIEVGIEPEQVRFEVTEHAVISDIDAARGMMQQLNVHGIQFLIDDFGTGYSNLQLLHQLPFHALKIDKSFIERITDNTEILTTVRAMVDLAHSLDLAVVAEGIETAAQHRIASHLGCDYQQGYFVGRPKPAIEINSEPGKFKVIAGK